MLPVAVRLHPNCGAPRARQHPASSDRPWVKPGADHDLLRGDAHTARPGQVRRRARHATRAARGGRCTRRRSDGAAVTAFLAAASHAVRGNSLQVGSPACRLYAAIRPNPAPSRPVPRPPEAPLRGARPPGSRSPAGRSASLRQRAGRRRRPPCCGPRRDRRPASGSPAAGSPAASLPVCTACRSAVSSEARTRGPVSSTCRSSPQPSAHVIQP